MRISAAAPPADGRRWSPPQRYPDDFDGIIAGAPFNQALSVPHMIWADRANTGADGQPILNKAQFELLHKAALASLRRGRWPRRRHHRRPASTAGSRRSRWPARPEQTGACLTRRTGGGGADDLPGPGERRRPAARRLRAVRRRAGQRAHLGAAARSAATARPRSSMLIGQDWLHYHAFEPDPPADCRRARVRLRQGSAAAGGQRGAGRLRTAPRALQRARRQADRLSRLGGREPATGPYAGLLAASSLRGERRGRGARAASRACSCCRACSTAAVGRARATWIT